MSKADNKFINVNQTYELEDWLYRNGFSKKAANVEELKKIILLLKEGNSTQNLSWEELDAALKQKPSLFGKLAAIGQ